MDRFIVKFQEGSWSKIFSLKPLGEASSETQEELGERISDLLAGIPERHRYRRESEEKVIEKLIETYPEKKKEWDNRVLKAEQYEHALSEYRALRNKSVISGEDLDVDPPKVPEFYPVPESLKPICPEPLPEDTFDETSLKDCVNEIQMHDFEEYGLRVVDSAYSGELLTITNEED